MFRGCKLLPASQLWPDVEGQPRTSLAVPDRLAAGDLSLNSEAAGTGESLTTPFIYKNIPLLPPQCILIW